MIKCKCSLFVLQESSLQWFSLPCCHGRESDWMSSISGDALPVFSHFVSQKKSISLRVIVFLELSK